MTCFISHTALLEAGERKIKLRTLKMNGSTMLFLCDNETESVDELAVAMPSFDGKTSIATTVLGPQVLTDSQLLATKLSKRFKQQFFVSCNVQLDRITAPLFERSLMDYIRNNETKFV